MVTIISIIRWTLHGQTRRYFNKMIKTIMAKNLSDLTMTQYKLLFYLFLNNQRNKQLDETYFASQKEQYLTEWLIMTLFALFGVTWVYRCTKYFDRLYFAKIVTKKYERKFSKELSHSYYGSRHNS